MGDQLTAAPVRASSSLAGTGFWFLWANAVSLALIVSADRFTFLWLVEDTLGSPTWASGLIVFALGAPVCAFVLTAGALADRHDRRRMMLVTQTAGTSVVGIGAVLVWTGVIGLASAVVLAAAFGTVVAFAMPVRSSLVPALVGTERVMQAVVLMTIGSNVAMIVGPLLVGNVIEEFGVGWAFAVQACCFLLGLAAATADPPPPHPSPLIAVTSAPRSPRRSGSSGTTRCCESLFLLLSVGGGLMGGSAFTPAAAHRSRRVRPRGRRGCPAVRVDGCRHGHHVVVADAIPVADPAPRSGVHVLHGGRHDRPGAAGPRSVVPRARGPAVVLGADRRDVHEPQPGAHPGTHTSRSNGSGDGARTRW